MGYLLIQKKSYYTNILFNGNVDHFDKLFQYHTRSGEEKKERNSR